MVYNIFEKIPTGVVVNGKCDRTQTEKNLLTAFAGKSQAHYELLGKNNKFVIVSSLWQGGS